MTNTGVVPFRAGDTSPQRAPHTTRWKVTIYYKGDVLKPNTYYLEAADELSDILERGPDWDLIDYFKGEYCIAPSITNSENGSHNANTAQRQQAQHRDNDNTRPH